MISRRLIRIKLMQIIYGHFIKDEKDIEKTEKELLKSIQHAYDLYFLLFQLIIDVVHYYEERILLAKQKKVPTYADLHPDTRLIDNRLIKQLSKHRRIMDFKNSRIRWNEENTLLRQLYQNILNSKAYKTYMELPEPDYKDDKKIIIQIYEKEIAGCEVMFQLLEEADIYWNDDVEFVISMIIRTIRGMKEGDGEGEGEESNLMEIYKSDNDREYALKLLRKSILHYDEHKKIIDKYVKNWDVDRIAFIDTVIMEQALAEILYFPTIPVKVSLNEYIELAKFYSTNKSGVFINGILDRIIEDLKKENRIIKQGEGLKEN